MRLHQRERGGIHGNLRYCVEISGCVSIKERGIHGEGNRRCKIITLPMKRAREREGSRNRHTPLHCYFFLCKQYHKGRLVVVAKRYAMVSACPFFYVYVTIYVGMNKTAPKDASTISTTSIQHFMMYKT